MRHISINMKINAFEVASRYVYPSIRRRIVEILSNEHKLNQREIARLIHITQSAVSRYIRQNRGTYIEIEQFKDIDEEIRKMVQWIIKDEPNEYDLHKKIIEISLEMLGKGYVCVFHHEIDESVDPSSCKTCIDLFG